MNFCIVTLMFSTPKHLERKTGADGVGRYDYLQQLVTEFQDSNSLEAREQVLANLANFAYDPINYEHLRRLNVIDLFLDHLTDENPRLVEFAIGGICNLCLDKINKEYILQNNGIPAVIHCLSSTSDETVFSAITTLMFLVTPASKPDITSVSVIDCMLRFTESSNKRLSNLAHVFLQDYCTPDQIQHAKSAKPNTLLGISLPPEPNVTQS